MGIDDLSLFRDELQDVTPLHPVNHVRHHTRKPPAIPLKTLEDEQQVIRDMLSDAYDPTELQPGDMLSYYRPGIQLKVFRKLRAGQYRTAVADNATRLQHALHMLPACFFAVDERVGFLA